MLKKSLNLFIMLFLVFFIYNTYIKKDKEIKIEFNNDIKTTNIIYNFDNYKIKAEIQTNEAISKKEIFEQTLAYFKTSILKGNKAEIDKNSNMVLRGNIKGTNSKNGWELETEELKYLAKSKRIIGNRRLTAINKEEDLKFISDTFNTNSDFSYFELIGNIKIYHGDSIIYADRAVYSEKDQNLEISGNIIINYKSQKKMLIGKFTKLNYNLKKEILISNLAYKLEMNNYTLSAKKFYYDNIKQVVIAEKDVKIYDNLKNLEMSKINYNLNNKQMIMIGEIHGNYEDFSFIADKGEAFIDSKELFLYDNIIINKEGNKIYGDKVIYNEENKKMLITGNKLRVELEKYHLISTLVEYNLNKSELQVPNNFEMLEKENKIEIYGNKLLYKIDTEKGIAEDITIINKNNKATSDNIFIDYNNKKYTLKNNVNLKNDEYRIKTDKIEMIDKDILYIPNEYTIINEKGNINGTNAIYNDIDKILLSDEKSNLKNDEYNIYFLKYKYDLKNNQITLENIIGENFKEKIKFRADNGIYIQGTNDISLKKNVEIDYNNYTAYTEKAIYNDESKLIEFPVKAFILSKDKKLKGEIYSGEIDLNNNEFLGNKFIANNEKSKILSDEIKYDIRNEIAYLNENVKYTRDNIEILTNNMIYYKLTEYIDSPEPIVFKRNNIKITLDNAKINLNKKIIKGENPLFTTINGNIIKGNYIYGEYYKNEFNFYNGLEAKIIDEKTKNSITFEGETAKIYFTTKGDKQELTRAEIKDKVDFYYKNLYLNSNYLELDNIGKTVFSTGESILEIDKTDKISSQNLEFDINNEIAKMKENVKIFNISKESGDVNTRADEAIFNNTLNKIDLSGNVISYKGDTKILADSGIYDLKQNKLYGKGNIAFTFDIETLEQKKNKEKNEKKNIEVINKTIEKIKIPKVLTEKIKTIDLKKRDGNVIIIWNSSNKNIISKYGEVNHPKYLENDEVVILTATYKLYNTEIKKEYIVKVEKESKDSYINGKILETKFDIIDNKLIIENKDLSYQFKKIKKIDDNKNIFENEFEFKLKYRFEDIEKEIEYKGYKENKKIEIVGDIQ
ncbi:lipopolysaccharide-assembly LptC-related protein [Hypnocyclicus thermotrophus]|uniref:Lipopolysaccharide-assembly LptC-related protein n=1 Tax=Hypnocyclicus thermotrophus TaxID=1627895 RepID=A0AA46DY60_9FUSO|nr:immunoglobulin-like domain-containing protein [Hypnocyclicus thermotrophus]TDT69219.1 lipopolysaccharide-assembly LptC-related protein [Hypnocyclicus thermotrophus]